MVLCDANLGNGGEREAVGRHALCCLLVLLGIAKCKPAAQTRLALSKLKQS